MIWYCPFAFYRSEQCRSRCINNYGRYCAQDPEQDFSRGYNGKDVVFQNLRQACFLKVANENGKPWLWWDYVTDFAIRCSVKEKKYNKDCSDQVIKSLDRLKTSCEYISLDSLHKRLFILFIYIYIYIYCYITSSTPFISSDLSMKFVNIFLPILFRVYCLIVSF